MTTHDLEVAEYADRVLTLRDGALGQDISDSKSENKLGFDDHGRIQLPDAVRIQLAHGSNIAVEIRPEGVLLRPEQPDEDNVDALLQDILPQDAPPDANRRFRIFRRRKKKESEEVV